MTALRNIGNIVQKEWRQYFVSPIAYVALALWALVVGVFYFLRVGQFLQASQQMAMRPGPYKPSINDWIIQGNFYDMAIIALFVMPMITMRLLAEEKRQVRFNFISVLAHELKAPLNAVEGYLNILRTTEEDQNLQMVERSIVRVDGMKKLIGDLLDLTRIESGQRERVIKRLDLAELARTSMELFAVDAERHGITMQVEADRDVELNADPGEVEIVFNNLVSNAVKYNRDGGTVTVKLSRKDDAVRIAVSDTGIGLRPEEAAKLFNEFTRIKNEHTVKILGSGLGLSTVRKIANMYDGEAEVRSEPGEGSTFTVTLHDAPAESGRPAAADRSTTATAVPPA